MATLIRIRLPNRSEYRKYIWSRKDSVVLLGDTYHIDYNKGFFVKTWFGKVVCLDYEKGVEEPISYFTQDVNDEPRTKHKPHHVAEVIRRLIEEIPHFQILALILLIICIAVGCIACYLGWDAGTKSSDTLEYLKSYVNATRGYP